MKKIIAILGILAIAILFGCTQAAQNGSGLMSDTNKIDSNNGGKGYTNLDNFAQLVRVGDKVSVNYTGKFTDGNVFDTSLAAGRTPLQFTVGAHSVITGFENAVVGMKVGDTKTVTLPPGQAYGEYDQNKVKYLLLDKNQFSDFNSLIVGSEVYSSNFKGIIMEKNDQNAVVSMDTNPPLAGKTLVFEITLVSINQ